MKDRKRLALCNMERLLVPAENVAIVEFHRWDTEVDATQEEVDELNRQVYEWEEKLTEAEVPIDGKTNSKTESAVQSAESAE